MSWKRGASHEMTNIWIPSIKDCYGLLPSSKNTWISFYSTAISGFTVKPKKKWKVHVVGFTVSFPVVECSVWLFNVKWKIKYLSEVNDRIGAGL